MKVLIDYKIPAPEEKPAGPRTMRMFVVLLCAALIGGCEAAARDHSATAEGAAAGVVPAAVGQRRAIGTRALLLTEGLIRDRSGVVTSSRCSEGQELLVGLATPPLCDELTIESLGTTYRAFLFSQGHDTLVIYHEGHNLCDEHWTFADVFQLDAAHLTSKLLERADVLYFDMPMVATNCGQEIDVGAAVYVGTNHNWFALLDKPGDSGLAYFFNHINRALDFLGPTYPTIHMVGRSGGGWATTIYAALDWRITRSVSVAGGLPIEFRGPELDGRDDLGDWEQYGAHVFRLVSYQELYEAAGGLQEPRRHIQIFNEFDPCCFAGAKGSRAAGEYAASDKGYMQERVKFLINTGNATHSIPIDMVLAELFGP